MLCVGLRVVAVARFQGVRGVRRASDHLISQLLDVLLIYPPTNFWMSCYEVKLKVWLGMELLVRREKYVYFIYHYPIVPRQSALSPPQEHALRSRDGISMYLFGQCIVWKSVFWWQYICMDFKFSVKLWLNSKFGEENFTKSLQLARMGTMDSVRGW